MARRTRRKRAPRIPRAKLSEAGHAFLQCAFASPDFNTDPGKGIPDSFQGKVLVRKDVLTQSISPTAAKDTFYLVAPTPSVAYYSCEVAAGSFPTAASQWIPTYFPGITTLFGKTSTVTSAGVVTPGAVNERAEQVTAFRYASLNVGIYPTSNLMQFAGSVTCWKIPLKMQQQNYAVTIPTTAPQVIQQTGWFINGLEGVSAVSPDNYAGTFIEGEYMTSLCNEPEFEFTPILEGMSQAPMLGTSGNPNNQFGALLGDMLGVGNMDTLVIRVSSPAAAVNNALMKVWACIEYRVNSNSALYQSAHDSPPLDNTALELYREVAKLSPIAVPYHQNAGAWERAKKIMNSLLTGMSYAPGPAGALATGIRATTSALQQLWV